MVMPLILLSYQNTSITYLFIDPKSLYEQQKYIKLKLIILLIHLNFFPPVIEIDSVGTYTMCHEALKYLKKGGPGKGPSMGGLIINISATLHYTASWYQLHVSAAKVCWHASLCE